MKVELIKIEKSPSKNKKFRAYFKVGDKEKHTDFGAEGYEDYTIHKDKQRRDKYIQRHKKDLNTNDPTKPGFLSMYVLWNKPSLNNSIKDYKNRLKNNNWSLPK